MMVKKNLVAHGNKGSASNWNNKRDQEGKNNGLSRGGNQDNNNIVKMAKGKDKDNGSKTQFKPNVFCISALKKDTQLMNVGTGKMVKQDHIVL